MIQLYSVLSNAYRLDGGAMFGNAPRAMWERWIPPDELNRLRLATRALVVITPTETLLFEAGIGAYLEPKLRDRYGVPEPHHRLLESLAHKGIAPQAVTRIFISHMHFDHAGGLLSAWQPDREPELLFPNAKYYVGEAAWQRAVQPISRDKASFIPALHTLLEQSQRLVLLQPTDRFTFDALELSFFYSDGHTPGLLCADLRYGGERLVYASDLVPGRFWVHLPIGMGYDRYAELLIDEKKALLASLAEDNAWIFYVHDPDFAASKVRYDAEHKTYVAAEPQRELIIGPRG
jgi:glyoxylase-like metal-dependent hydrolase (beta-lactamase superfamily II)